MPPFAWRQKISIGRLGGQLQQRGGGAVWWGRDRKTGVSAGSSEEPLLLPSAHPFPWNLRRRKSSQREGPSSFLAASGLPSSENQLSGGSVYLMQNQAFTIHSPYPCKTHSEADCRPMGADVLLFILSL